MNTTYTASHIQHDRALRISDLCKLLGLSRSTIYGKLNTRSSQYDDKFPKPFKIAAKAVAWSSNEILHWFEGKKASKRN